MNRQVLPISQFHYEYSIQISKYIVYLAFVKTFGAFLLTKALKNARING